MRKIITHLFIFLSVIVFVSCGSEHADVFVSPSGKNANAGTREMPVQTIEKGLEIIEALREESNASITLHVLEGDYHLTKTLQLDAKMSNVSIIGEGDVTVKGSTEIPTAWKAYDDNIWVTDIKNIPSFNQLFIDGEQQILARYPNYDEHGGYWQGSASDAIAKERIATWNNPVGGFVHAMHRGRWGGFHYEITGVDDAGELTLIGGHQNNRPSEMNANFRMVENIFEELDSENEWYSDENAKKLYLWHKNGQDLNTASVEVASLKQLINIKGTENNPVTNITIEGIQFEHAMRTFMEDYDPLLRSDWTIYRGGALVFDGTENCAVRNCEFNNLGGNVIFANAYNRGLEVTGNHIHDCGASAICFVGDTSAVRSPSYQYSDFVPLAEMDTVVGPANNLYPSECKVENNLIHRIGRVEKQVAGVQISMAMKIHVKNNSIYDVPRAGINVSEGTWGGHLIEYNDVFNTVLESSDHGAFNSWGRDRFWYPKWDTISQMCHDNPQMPMWDAIHTTVIRNNRFRCDHGWDIDLDDGSSNYHIYNNVCLNGGLKLREGFFRVVENNIMINNTFHPHVWFDNSEDVFRKNIVMKSYRPIRLAAWGKEVDYNLFPDAKALAKAHKKNTDAHSLCGNPMFMDAANADFTVADSSQALTLGFENFPMDQFGVQKDELKAIAKTPEIPELVIASVKEDASVTKKWKGALLKNILSPEEQSSLGLFSMDGALVVKLEPQSVLALSGLKEGDVIIKLAGKEVKSVSELLKKSHDNSWHHEVILTIVRHQEELKLILKR